jgi:hypothetical protein
MSFNDKSHGAGIFGDFMERDHNLDVQNDASNRYP